MRRGAPFWIVACAVVVAVFTAPRAHAIVGSNSGTTIFDGLFINDQVGAGTFYSLGFGGGRAIVANIEAGSIWNGHETLAGRVSQFIADPAIVSTGTTQLGQFDWHATMVGQTLGGIMVSGSQYNFAAGIAPTAQLWSGAIATQWTGSGFSGSFEATDQSFLSPYVTAMRTGIVSGSDTLRANVVNSSWGYTDSAGRESWTVAIDALALQNNVVTVISAGNAGPTANTVGGPASGYNGIAVAALTSDTSSPPYGQPADFSSRGPGDFYNPQSGTTVPGVRPTVDIAAPGDNLTLALYGGTTGGNLTGANPWPASNYYYPNIGGTSFASPIVAGGAALMVDAGKLFVSGSVAPSEMLDARVIKAALLAGAEAPTGWNNGQVTVGGTTVTTQALDYVTGAGILDLDSTYRTYVGDPASITIDNVTYVFAGINTTLGVSGSGGGSGLELRGWDLGSVISASGSAGNTNVYGFGSALAAGETLTAALTWFADRTLGTTIDTAADVALSNLALEVWRNDGLDGDSLVARSNATYSSTEFLRFTVPQSGSYSLRVVGLDQLYDLSGSPDLSTSYGLAWRAVAVPEPGTLLLAGVAIGTATVCGRRRQRRRAA
jgi:hypothetical protein